MKNPFENFGPLDPFEPIAEKLEAFKEEFKFYIIAGIIIILLISLLIDIIRRYIRGLDMAAIGGLLLWISFRIADVPIVKILCGILNLVGGTLLAAGLAIFAAIRLTYYLKKRRRMQKLANAPQDPLLMLEGLRDAGILTQQEFRTKKREFDL